MKDEMDGSRGSGDRATVAVVFLTLKHIVRTYGDHHSCL